MGQPRVASATWRDQNRRISQDFYEAVGQHMLKTVTTGTRLASDHGKSLNLVSSRQAKFLHKTKGNRQIFRLMGRLCNKIICRFGGQISPCLWVDKSVHPRKSTVNATVGKNCYE